MRRHEAVAVRACDCGANHLHHDGRAFFAGHVLYLLAGRQQVVLSGVQQQLPAWHGCTACTVHVPRTACYCHVHMHMCRQ
jgi:hypothetical protein